MPAASGSCSKEGCQDLNFGRNAVLWLVVVLLLFGLFNLFQGSAPRGPQLRQRSKLLDSLIRNDGAARCSSG